MTSISSGRASVLLVDLNNFAHYPTVPVGLLVAALRQAGHAVAVFSPMTVGVKGFGRAGRASWFGQLDLMLRFATAMTTHARVRDLRARVGRMIRPDGEAASRRISGSQRILNAMGKGTNLARTSQFVRDAHAAGISLRTTVIVGYPGETASDVHKTADFLREHAYAIERVMVNRFSIMPGTRVHQRRERKPGAYPSLELRGFNGRNAVIEHYNRALRSPGYLRSIWNLLGVANGINRKRMSEAAEVFEGVL